MIRLALAAAFAAAVSIAPAFAVSPLERVNKAIDAIGRSGLEQLNTFSVKGKGKFWEPDESHHAGGEPLHVTDLTFETTRNLATYAARTSWVRDYLVIPWPRMNHYTEIVADGVGFVDGNDGGPRTASLQTGGNQKPMTGIRLAATARELQRTSPALLREMAKNPSALSEHPAVRVGGKRLPALRYKTNLATYIVLFDPKSGLPERVRTIDFDPLRGDTTYDWIVSDWRAAGPVKYPFKQRYEVDGSKLMEFTIDEATANPSVPANAFAVPDAIKASAPKIATNNVPYLWILRRQLIGSYYDVDNLTHDPARVQLQLVDRAPGITQVQGTIHHTLFVEMDKYLVVFDAPYMDAYSKWAIEQAKKKFPNKPIKYLVMTHHHIDHVAGYRSFVAEGAALVVGKGTRKFWQRTLASTDRLGADTPKKKLKADIIEVKDSHVITDGKRRIELYDLPTEHSDGMLAGFIPDAKMMFQTDVWTGPGVDPLGAQAMPRQRSLVEMIQKRKLNVETMIGGHGRVGAYADLLKTADSTVAAADSVHVVNNTGGHVHFNISPNGSYWIPFELEKGKAAPIFNAAFINVVTGKLVTGDRAEKTEKVEKGKRYQIVADPECKCRTVKPAP